MDAKTELVNLVRIACLHKLQHNNAKAKETFEKALTFWAHSGLPVSDWSDMEFEFFTCHHNPERVMKGVETQVSFN